MEKLRKVPLRGQSRRKTTLHVDFDFDFRLIGLVSPVRDYRIAWLLNRELKIELERKEDLEIEGGKNLGRNWFSRFEWENMLDKSRFCLISNRFSGEYLIPERKSVDYFLLVYGTWYEKGLSDLLNSIKPIPDIQTTITIDPRDLRSRLNLILE
ncbi:MAG: hypothetical protein ACI959_000020 [Limisphaerales bacterium]